MACPVGEEGNDPLKNLDPEDAPAFYHGRGASKDTSPLHYVFGDARISISATFESGRKIVIDKYGSASIAARRSPFTDLPDAWHRVSYDRTSAYLQHRGSTMYFAIDLSMKGDEWWCFAFEVRCISIICMVLPYALPQGFPKVDAEKEKKIFQKQLTDICEREEEFEFTEWKFMEAKLLSRTQTKNVQVIGASIALAAVASHCFSLLGVSIGPWVGAIDGKGRSHKSLKMIALSDGLSVHIATHGTKSDLDCSALAASMDGQVGV